MGARSSRAEPQWARWDDQRLLDMRMCDLQLRMERPWLLRRIEQLRREMTARKIRFRPRMWLSDEWFTPKESPGIAIPFYLAHRRLVQLERAMMLEAEGESQAECMRILRHEAGHAIQFAYQLHRRRRWRELFGSAAAPYPETYQPRPYSRRYVLHIDNHYAQAHPDEDFAETFAVWLTPGYNWRRRYAAWPALRKLEYVDELMAEIAGEPPLRRPRRAIDPISSMRLTLREHYRQRQEGYGRSEADVYSRDLRKLFAGPEAGGMRATTLLRRRRRELLRIVSRWTGEYQYAINDVYTEMLDGCERHDLRVPQEQPEERMVLEIAAMLTVQTMQHLQMGGRRIRL
ncbi:MAG: putative zinc-binding metallopeptidase [Phycisphaerales bacterium JB039]